MSDIIDRLETPLNSFISGYVIKPEICDELINYFTKNKHKASPGCMWDTTVQKRVVKKHLKDSLDLVVNPSETIEPIKKYRLALQECFDKHSMRYNQLTGFSPITINEPINIQYYPVGGGFKTYHCERKHPSKADRVMVFMTYLNDVDDGGTKFEYLNIETPAVKGLTLLWPPEWTHSHKGVVSKTKEKYIITGWYNLVPEDKCHLLPKTPYGNSVKRSLSNFINAR